MDERDHKAMNDELKSAEELANNWADEYYERESERTSIIMEKDEWLNRRYNFLTGYNRCKEDLKKQLKEKEEEMESLKMKLSAMKIGVDYPKKITELQEQLTKSNEMNEKLAGQIGLFLNFGGKEHLEEAIEQYQNSKK